MSEENKYEPPKKLRHGIYPFDDMTEYVRKDLVDGLVEALEEFVPPTQAVDAPCHFGIVPQSDCAYCNRIKKARAALKALEEPE